MMHGIEILAQEPIYGHWGGLTLIILGLCIASGLVIAFTARILDDAGRFIVAICCILLSFFICFIINEVTKQPTGQYQYKVIVDDSVIFNEFSEKYKIIDQEGKIYTIQERDGSVEYGND